VRDDVLHRMPRELAASQHDKGFDVAVCQRAEPARPDAANEKVRDGIGVVPA